jgi:hypothetical protein
MAWISENKYMLAGTITAGLTLDSSNPGAGTAPAGYSLYGSGTYGSDEYQIAAYYEGVYESLYYNNKLTITTSGDSGDIKYTYALSDDGITFTDKMVSPGNIVGTTSLTMRAKYFRVRLYYHPTLWSDSDSFAITAIAAAFTTFAAGTVVDANEMNGNFDYVGKGDWIPVGNTALEPTTSSYNIGSVDYKWNTVYLNELVCGSDVEKTFNVIGSVVLSAAASSMEITGINSSIDQIYNIIVYINNNNGYSEQFKIYYNGVSSGSYYVDKYKYNNNVITRSVSSSEVGFVVHNPSADTNGSKYGYAVINGKFSDTSTAYHGCYIECVDFSGNYIMERSIAQSLMTVSTFSAITSVKIVGPTASALGAGSQIQVWAPR